MNVDNNKRFEETEKKIFQAYGVLVRKKGIEKIKVSDICKEANIHRTTFYGHFEDIYDMHKKLEMHQFGKFMNAFTEDNGNWDLRVVILKILDFYESIQDVMRFQMEHEHGSNMRNNMNGDIIKMEYKEKYMKSFQLQTEEEFVCHNAFLTAGMYSVIYQWALTGCKIEKNTVADFLCQMVGNSVLKQTEI